MIGKMGSPGWPMKVGSNNKRDEIEQIKMSTNSSASALWMKKRIEKPKGEIVVAKGQHRPVKFAAKLVRQCAHCQLLYTNFHNCQPSESQEFS
jgi:hypothetical protein